VKQGSATGQCCRAACVGNAPRVHIALLHAASLNSPWNAFSVVGGNTPPRQPYYRALLQGSCAGNAPRLLRAAHLCSPGNASSFVGGNAPPPAPCVLLACCRSSAGASGRVQGREGASNNVRPAAPALGNSPPEGQFPPSLLQWRALSPPSTASIAQYCIRCTQA